MVKLQEKPSALKREHPALLKMKLIHFFLFFWVIFVLLDPDPTQIRIRIRIQTQIRIRIRIHNTGENLEKRNVPMTSSTAGTEENAQVVGGPFRIGLAAVRTLVVSCSI